MRTNAKQAYVTPEFRGTQVKLESCFLGNSVNKVGDPVSNDGNITIGVFGQGGFDNTTGGFVSTSTPGLGISGQGGYSSSTGGFIGTE